MTLCLARSPMTPLPIHSHTRHLPKHCSMCWSTTLPLSQLGSSGHGELANRQSLIFYLVKSVPTPPLIFSPFTSMHGSIQEIPFEDSFFWMSPPQFMAHGRTNELSDSNA